MHVLPVFAAFHTASLEGGRSTVKDRGPNLILFPEMSGDPLGGTKNP